MPRIAFHFSTPLEMLTDPSTQFRVRRTPSVVRLRSPSRRSGENSASLLNDNNYAAGQRLHIVPHYRIQHGIRMTEVGIHFCEINYLWVWAIATLCPLKRRNDYCVKS